MGLLLASTKQIPRGAQSVLWPSTSSPPAHASKPREPKAVVDGPLSVAAAGGDKTQIGLVHNWFWFEPKRSCCTPPYLTWLCAKLNHMWGNEVVVRYLQTGVLDWNPSW